MGENQSGVRKTNPEAVALVWQKTQVINQPLAIGRWRERLGRFLRERL